MIMTMTPPHNHRVAATQLNDDTLNLSARICMQRTDRSQSINFGTGFGLLAISKRQVKLHRLVDLANTIKQENLDERAHSITRIKHDAHMWNGYGSR